MPDQSLKVSIITPTYNRADFLPVAIESVQAQSFPDWEMLIVDDGSTDNTAELVNRYSAQDSRIRYFQQPNQGQSVARNHALGEARGEFICFLDSDNAWLPDKLEKQLAVFQQEPDVDIVYGDCITINEQGDEISRANMKRHSGRITLHLLKDNCVSMNTTMIRRRCFDEMGGFDEGDRLAEDYELWLRFSTRFRFHYIPEYLAYYRVMENQLSSDKQARFQANEAILTEFRARFPGVLSRKAFDAGFAHFYTRKARYLASTGQRGQALKPLSTALGYRPFYRVPWRALLAVLLKKRGH